MVRARSIAAALALCAAILPVAAPPFAASSQYWVSPRDRGRPVEGDYARAGYPPRWADGPPPGYRGPPPRYRAHCGRGGPGAIIGAIAGGLLGNAAGGRGDRGFGTVVGAGAGALTGREIDRDC